MFHCLQLSNKQHVHPLLAEANVQFLPALEPPMEIPEERLPPRT